MLILVLGLQLLNSLLLGLHVLLEVLDGGRLLFDLLLEVLFLGVEQLGVSLELGLFLGESVDFVFFLLNFFPLLGQLTLQLDDFLVEGGLGLFQVIDLGLLVLVLLLELLLGPDQLVHGVVLAERES